MDNQADGGKVGNLYLYGIIASESWWNDEITPKQMTDELKELGDIETLNVHIFSDGGDVFAGTAIYSILKQQTATVNVYIEGIAASIATIIAMAGEKIYISKSAMMMIHNPMMMLWGYYNEQEISSVMADLKKVREPLIATYQSRTGIERDEIIAAMDGENGAGTWYTAEEAIAAGLADEYIEEDIEDGIEAVACIGKDKYLWNGINFDLSVYQNAPEIKARRNTKTMAKNTKPKAVKPNKNKAIKARIIKTEITSVTCPECGATFDIEVGLEPVAEPQEAQDASKTKIKNELVEVTCPECDATFEADVELKPEAEAGEVEESGENGAENTGAEDRFNAGVISERQRIIDLDTIVAADPTSAEIVTQAKREGWSFEMTSRKVFSAKATQSAKANSGNKFLEGQAADLRNSGAANVGASPNSGIPGTGETEEQKAVAMIVAGFKK